MHIYTYTQNEQQWNWNLFASIQFAMVINSSVSPSSSTELKYNATNGNAICIVTHTMDIRQRHTTHISLLDAKGYCCTGTRNWIQLKTTWICHSNFFSTSSSICFSVLLNANQLKSHAENDENSCTRSPLRILEFKFCVFFYLRFDSFLCPFIYFLSPTQYIFK